jgi:hypothetical protein
LPFIFFCSFPVLLDDLYTHAGMNSLNRPLLVCPSSMPPICLSPASQRYTQTCHPFPPCRGSSKPRLNFHMAKVPLIILKCHGRPSLSLFSWSAHKYPSTASCPPTRLTHSMDAMRVILASNRGTLMELRISPIGGPWFVLGCPKM